MKSSDIRAMVPEEIQTRLAEWEEQLFRYGCEKKVGQLENNNLIRLTRRDIARAKTILTEKEHARSQSEA